MRRLLEGAATADTFTGSDTSYLRLQHCRRHWPFCFMVRVLRKNIRCWMWHALEPFTAPSPWFIQRDVVPHWCGLLFSSETGWELLAVQVFLFMDQGLEFQGEFNEGLESHGIQPILIDRDAPYQNGVNWEKRWPFSRKSTTRLVSFANQPMWAKSKTWFTKLHGHCRRWQTEVVILQLKEFLADSQLSTWSTWMTVASLSFLRLKMLHGSDQKRSDKQLERHLWRWMARSVWTGHCEPDHVVPEKTASFLRVSLSTYGDKDDVGTRQRLVLALWCFNEVIRSGLSEGVSYGNATKLRCSEWGTWKSRA